MNSGVPQGSVLGPVLFLLFINDIADLFGGGLNIKLFADDVKIYAVINDINDVNMFQAGLNKLHLWSCIWQLPISFSKCAVLHIGRLNDYHSYSVNGVCLPNVKEIVDLGVTMDSNLRFTKHYRITSNKANNRASLILKTFLSRDPVLLFKAFTVYVRPLLEYCSPVWAPVYKSDIEIIENVQRKFTKRLHGLKHLTYADRLVLLNNADSLELRRLKHDLIMIFKILHNFVCITVNEFFCLNPFTITRGHDFKLVKPLCTNNARQFSFACRRIDVWNNLPIHAVNCHSIQCFKALINRLDFKQYLKLQ